MNSLRKICLAGLIMSGTTSNAQQHLPSWQSKIWLGVEPNASEVKLRVMSSGCTKKEDFVFSVNNDKSVVSVTRVRLDRCRAKPKQIEFQYSFAELGITTTVYFAITDNLVSHESN